jgi:alpha-1,3-rhamnosyl/mannosyltransferase
VQGLVEGLATLDDAPAVVALGGDATALPAGVGHVAAPASPPTNLGWTLLGLPLAARRAGVDVIHAPAYTAPLWGAIPVVLTIHDVSYARRPDWYPYRRDLVRRSFYRRSALAASAVITDSHFSASEIRAAYGLSPSRIAVIPLGVDSTFTRAGEGDAACDLPGGIDGPFVLHVGDLHERRNLPVVLDAVLEARRQFGALPALSLVLAGVDRGVGDALSAIAARAGAPEALVRLGPVEEGQLRTLYRCASALVYPSMYEGFGLPVLEAMACGTPVIASNAASIPEVLGDAGLLLAPHDIPAWTHAIGRIVNDEHERTRLGAAGRARAAAFTWARTARMTLDVYNSVANPERRT